MRWLTRSIAIINATLKLLDIYKLLKHYLSSLFGYDHLGRKLHLFFPTWGFGYGEKKREIRKLNVKEILWLCVEGLPGPPNKHI